MPLTSTSPSGVAKKDQNVPDANNIQISPVAFKVNNVNHDQEEPDFDKSNLIRVLYNTLHLLSIFNILSNDYYIIKSDSSNKNSLNSSRVSSPTKDTAKEHHSPKNSLKLAQNITTESAKTDRDVVFDPENNKT